MTRIIETAIVAFVAFLGAFGYMTYTAMQAQLAQQEEQIAVLTFMAQQCGIQQIFPPLQPGGPSA